MLLDLNNNLYIGLVKSKRKLQEVETKLQYQVICQQFW